MNKGNIEMLEIKNQEIIENPNPENNVYTDYIYSKGFGRVMTNLFWWLIEFFLFVYGGYRLLYPLVRQRELNITVFVIFIIYIGAQIIWLSIGSMEYREIVLLFKCKWNFDAGLGVKLVNEDIVKVGIQSEVLI